MTSEEAGETVGVQVAREITAQPLWKRVAMLSGGLTVLFLYRIVAPALLAAIIIAVLEWGVL